MQEHPKRAYSVSQWQRDFAASFASAVPLEGPLTQARGALLAADNDEPEPLFTEAQLREADRAAEVRKDAECRNFTRASEHREMWRQQQRLDDVGRLWPRGEQ
jgi:hypothetical protein